MKQRKRQVRASPRQRSRARMAYLLAALAPVRPLVIVDIGANPVIPPDYRRLMRAGGCQVVGFEPQADAFARLMAAKADNETYVNAAVGGPGPATLRVYPSEGMTSLFPLHAPSLAYLGKFERQLGRETEVPMNLHPIDAIPAITTIDVLKIDVQGAEYDIISGGLEKLAQAVAIIPEVRFYRLYDGEPLFGDLDRLLHAMGFVLHKFLGPKAIALSNSQSARLDAGALRSQLVDGDAVYIRKMESPSDWSDTQLAHLAQAADGVFDSPDLALRCLDLLVARGVVAADVPGGYAAFLPLRQPRAGRKVLRTAGVGRRKAGSEKAGKVRARDAKAEAAHAGLPDVGEPEFAVPDAAVPDVAVPDDVAVAEARADA